MYINVVQLLGYFPYHENKTHLDMLHVSVQNTIFISNDFSIIIIKKFIPVFFYISHCYIFSI